VPIAKIIRSKSTICNFLVMINSITVAVSLIPFERLLSSILEIAIFAYSMDPSTGVLARCAQPLVVRGGDGVAPTKGLCACNPRFF